MQNSVQIFVLDRLRAMPVTIRAATASDHGSTELLTRQAFWNHFQPGSDEHYLLRLIRNHVDYIPELDLVAEAEDGKLIGSIVYTHSTITRADGSQVDKVITFGPVSVLPEYQRQGVGAELICRSLQLAKALGYALVVIFGHPRIYGNLGFRCAERFDIESHAGKFVPSMLVYPLLPFNLFANGQVAGRFKESTVFNINEEEARAFDEQNFPPLERVEDTASQREFQVLISLGYKKKAGLPEI